MQHCGAELCPDEEREPRARKRARVRPLRGRAAGTALALVIAGLGGGLGAPPSAAAASTTPTVTTVQMGSGPSGTAYNPTNGHVYVTNFFGARQSTSANGVVSVVSSTTNQVVATVPVGLNASGVAVDPATGRVFVTNQFDGTVSVIAGATNEVVHTIALAHASEPRAIAFDPVAGNVWVANQKSATVSVISAATYQEVTTLWLGPGFEPGRTYGTWPTALAVDPVSRRVYVARTNERSVTVVDADTTHAIGGFHVGGFPNAVAVDPRSGEVYVANGGDATLTVVDGRSDQVLRTVPLSAPPGGSSSLVQTNGIAYDAASDDVYVANRRTNTVSVIDASSFAEVRVVTVGDAPSAVVTDPADGDVYVANFGLQGQHDRDTLSVIRTTSQAVVFTSTPPTRRVVGGSYAATATGGHSGNPVTFSADAGSTPGSCSVSAAGSVAFTGIGTCVVNADQAGTTRYEAARRAQQRFDVIETQTVAFTSTPSSPPKVGDAYTATATGGGSGNPVVFSADPTSDPDACQVLASGAVDLTGVGTCVVAADQAASPTYEAAPRARQVLTVAEGLAEQRITFTSSPPADPKVRGAYTATATGGASGNPVVFSAAPSSTPGACDVSAEGLVRFTAVGTCTVDATQAGDAAHANAPRRQQSFAITKTEQIVTFTSTPPPDTTVGSTYLATATGGASGKPVVFLTVASGSVCDVRLDGKVTFKAPGTCRITAAQNGDDAYEGGSARQDVVVVATSRAQTITFTSTAPTDPAVGGSYAATASGGPSGNPVVFSAGNASTAGACTVSSTGAVRFTGTGTCAVDADQAGSDDYDPAATATQSLTVGRASQTVVITSTPPAASVVGVAYQVSADGGDSGQPVLVATSTPGTCTADTAGVVTFRDVGRCTITADQAGDARYLPAPQATQDVEVASNAQVISFTAPADGQVGESTTLSATGGPSGNPVTFSVAPTTPEGVCTLDGSTLSFDGAGSCVIDADQAAGGAYAVADRVQRTIEVSPGSQVIAFVPPQRGTYGGTATLSATGGPSGNPVTFSVDSSSDPGSCAVSGTDGSTLTYTGVGSCVVNADQAASADHDAAPRATRTIPVDAAVLRVTASSASAVYGAQLPAVLPSFDGFVAGDGPTSLSSPPSCSAAVPAGAGVGSYPTSCSGAASSNYTFEYVEGTLQIDPAPVVVTASSATTTYGAAAPAIVPVVSGLVGSDQTSVLGDGLSCGTSVGPTSSVAGGPYTSTCSGGWADNYTITYATGVVTVQPAPLTVVADPVSRTYGAADPPLTYAFVGFVDGEDAASATTGAASCTTTASTASEVGTYDVICAAGDLAAPNYDLQFTKAPFVVTPAPLTATADSASRVFGDANPPLSVTLSGFVNGDTAASATSGAASCSTTATTASGVGAYPVTCVIGTLVAPNYLINLIPGSLDVVATRTVSGTLTGPVHISAGEALLVPSGALVDGAITIAAGGALVIEGGSVTGRVSTTSPGGPRAVRICGARLEGGLSIVGATGPVVLGAADGCTSSAVYGNDSIERGTGGVSVVGVTVRGTLTVRGNRGGFTYEGNVASGQVRVSDNR